MYVSPRGKGFVVPSPQGQQPPCGETGKRTGLENRLLSGIAGSSPATGTYGKCYGLAAFFVFRGTFQ
jgi:hypothetical protein